MTDLAKLLELTPLQAQAAQERDHNLIVTAGAGSGKTRTLIVRYLSLLDEGLDPQRVVAITFTEKAAREMRNRLYEYTQKATEAVTEPAEHWRNILSKLDAARIGTIHSLCSEILRTHPAEARIDPRFIVLDENEAAALRAEVAANTVEGAADDPELVSLFGLFSIRALEALVNELLAKRLDANPVLAKTPDVRRAIDSALRCFVDQEEIKGAVDTLAGLAATGELSANADDVVVSGMAQLLPVWQAMETALAAEDPVRAAVHLFEIRQKYLSFGSKGKNSIAKQTAIALRNAYDTTLNPWLGGKKPDDTPPIPEEEAAYEAAYPALRKLYTQAENAYAQALEERRALDFDDLEQGALTLLQNSAIRDRWQTEIQAMLVDEFQDTNLRQRGIVNALCGRTPGKLFVVGDARQSIYRFRGANVAVFRSLQAENQALGGRELNFAENFRTHTVLLDSAGDLLRSVMGDQEIHSKPYFVPFSPQIGAREKQPTAISPFIQFVLGQKDSQKATTKQVAARSLAQHLVTLKQTGEIKRWDDVALLFRASSAYSEYEDALQEAGIPYVTVAGRGFYERPEVRDVLNILTALSNPWENLSMAGALRSPAFGLSDEALYWLRKANPQPSSLWQALQGDLAKLSPEMRRHAQRAAGIFNELLKDVDRLPVADLLQKLLSLTDYRAILATQHNRLGRNIDKLLSDARIGAVVNIRAFLEQVQTISDTGGREGEAAAEASGSIRLMTIHKAKGLEFPFVVLAYANYAGPKKGGRFYLTQQGDFAWKSTELTNPPLFYQLARLEDQEINDAESNRLLYVAMTRAEEKLLVSGALDGKGTARGWTKALLEASNVSPKALTEHAGEWIEATLESGNTVQASLLTIQVQPIKIAAGVENKPTSNEKPLFGSLIPQEQDAHDPEPAETASYLQRITGDARSLSIAVGNLVHRALQNWWFPGHPSLRSLLESVAIRDGLINPDQRQAAIAKAETLLERFRSHPIWQEVDTALERQHEIPYSFSTGDKLDIGAIDLLYRLEDGWHLLDYKTDELDSEAELAHVMQGYRIQIVRYTTAFRRLHGPLISTRLCFLDFRGGVRLVIV
ncbi:MAG TPA: UvrD-helicase domain-containing protein [Anaerolineales bacterium]|nr:UvrD-helicase domain-containing protein [Anaerolineales bacterium]